MYVTRFYGFAWPRLRCVEFFCGQGALILVNSRGFAFWGINATFFAANLLLYKPPFRGTPHAKNAHRL